MNTINETNKSMRFKELFLVSNLFSLFRVLIIPVLWHYISQPAEKSAYIALAILIIAGISDGLDGYLARKLNQISQLGMILDPLADKILALALVVLLAIYRDFPDWLAVLIVGRDILILAAAAVLLKGSQVVVPSSITGKYAFFFIVALLACSVIRFEYGVEVLTYVVAGLLLASIAIYAQTFVNLKKGKGVPAFQDNLYYRIIRIGLTAIIMISLIVKLYLSF